MPDATSPLGDVEFVVLDVETTGLEPDWGHRVCEVALIVWQGGAEIDRFQTAPNQPVALLFGPDSGGVRERADAIVKALVSDDTLAVARFEESDLAEAGQLADKRDEIQRELEAARRRARGKS